MSENAESGGGEGVSTTRTSFEVLELLRDRGPLTLGEVRDATGLAKSTVHRHLSTLLDMRYLVEEEGRYRLSLRFLQLSEPPRIRKSGYVVAKQKVIELAKETEERALFLVPEHYDGVYVHRAGGRNPLHSDTMIGQRRPLHALASGKAVLAEWPGSRVDDYVAQRGLERLTDNTVTDPEALGAELAEVRERGFATNAGEHIEGLRAVGVPVHDREGDLLGALSVFGPAGRVSDEDIKHRYPELLKTKAQELTIDLTYE
jgi:DNA-binding IclR family transcriptional regulator